MDLGGFKLFSMLQTRMDWLGDRQRVLSENVANADTPGYGAKDLKPLTFRSLLSGTAPVAMEATAQGHLAGRPIASRHGEAKVRIDGEVAISENAVDLEAELRKVSETSIDYQAMVNIYRKHVDMMRTAIGRGA